MIKILGCILIMCASIGSCILYEKSEKSKLYSLKSIINFIKHIHSQIEYFSISLDKIYSSYQNHTDITNKIIQKDFENIKEFLEKDDYQVVIELFDSLGKGLKNEQLALCTYSINKLEESYKAKDQNYPNNIKAFRATALFCGFGAIILFI